MRLNLNRFVVIKRSQNSAKGRCDHADENAPMRHVDEPEPHRPGKRHVDHAVERDSDVKDREKPPKHEKLDAGVAALPLRLGKHFRVVVTKADLREIRQLHVHHFPLSARGPLSSKV